MTRRSQLLEVEGLSAGYGKLEILHAIALHVDVGEFVAVVGANGAGKSTLLRALMGLIPARGAIRYGGLDLITQPAHRRAALGIAYVPEGRRVFPGLTVEENLRVPFGGVFRQTVPEGFERVYEVFPKLRARRNQAARTLSGGEQQMLALGRALVRAPQLLIADEVSLGLAPIVVEAIFEVLGEMNRAGTTVLLAEQNVRISLQSASRAYVLETGRVALEGSAAQLRDNPRVVSAYLQEF